MPNPSAFRLLVPNIRPTTDEQSAENWRTLEDWGQRLAPTGRTLLGSKKLVTVAPSVTFANLPQNFNHLHLLAGPKTTATPSNNIRVVFNNDTSANYYSFVIYQSNGAAPATFSEAGATSGRFGIVSDNRWALSQGTVLDYTSRHHKMMTFNSSCYGTNNQTESGDLLYQNNTAITSVQFTNGGANFDLDSTFYVYGEY